ncbi:MAG: hypothetical protein AAB487_02940 [Patescibacteria group bacterium]
MQLKPPKNTEKYFWTQHAAFKLRQYGLSAQRVIRVINNPQRKEEGIVEKTVAVMQPASVRAARTSAGKPAGKTWSQEIWAMYQTRGAGNPKSKILNHKVPHPALCATLSQIGRGGLGKQIKIISAWRYPGVSPKKDPIPEDILREISELSD